jgi:hypothetical protein
MTLAHPYLTGFTHGFIAACIAFVWAVCLEIRQQRRDIAQNGGAQ